MSHTKPISRIVTILLLLGVSLPAYRNAHGAPGSANVAVARQHYQQGRTAYRQGKFRQAISQFAKAQTLKPHPIILFNLGQCHRQLREHAKALLYYKLYLSQRPRATNRAEVRRFIKSMASKAAEKARLRQLGKLTVITHPAGARLFVDKFRGRPQGVSPATLSLKAGQHVLEVRLAGYRTVYRKVSITAKQVTLLRVTLQRPQPRPRKRPQEVWIPPPLPNIDVTRPPARRRVVRLPPRRRVVAPPPKPVPKQPVPFYKTAWFWSGVGVTIGSIVLTSVFGKLALDRDKAWKDEKYAPNPDRTIQSQGQAFAIASDVFLAVSLFSAAAVTAAALVVALTQRTLRRDKTAVLPSCSSRGCGLWVQGKF